jgi:hypothetical protein
LTTFAEGRQATTGEPRPTPPAIRSTLLFLWNDADRSLDGQGRVAADRGARRRRTLIAKVVGYGASRRSRTRTSPCRCCRGPDATRRLDRARWRPSCSGSSDPRDDASCRSRVICRCAATCSVREHGAGCCSHVRRWRRSCWTRRTLPAWRAISHDLAELVKTLVLVTVLHHDELDAARWHRLWGLRRARLRDGRERSIVMQDGDLPCCAASR